jgi:hypothetical protein
MTPQQPRQEYIITKATIKKIIEYSGCEDSVACIKDLLKKEARPHTQTQESTNEAWKRGYNDGASSVIVDLNILREEAAAQAREKVLDELQTAFDGEQLKSESSFFSAKFIRYTIKSLRTPTSKEQQR